VAGDETLGAVVDFGHEVEVEVSALAQDNVMQYTIAALRIIFKYCTEIHETNAGHYR